MNGCNNCKFKDGYMCMSPAASFKVFNRDKGSLITHQASRTWHRGEKEHCVDHEIKMTLTQHLMGIFK